MHLPGLLRDDTLRVVYLLSALTGMGFGLAVPFLSLMARDRGISLGVIGIMASSYLITQMFLQLPFGSLADRFGRMPPIAVGLVLEGIATLGFVVAEHPAVFIGLRVLQGMSLALIMPAMRALVADLAPADRRGQAYAGLFASYMVGLLLGPPLSGLLVNFTGRETLFLIAGVFNLLLAAWTVLRLLPLSNQRTAQEDSGPAPWRDLLVRPLLGAYTLGLGGRVLEGMFVGVWSIYMEDIGASDFEIGLTFSTFAIAFMIAAPFGGRLADRRPRWPKLLVANLMVAGLITSYGFIELVPLILFIGLVEGAVATVSTPALDAYLAEHANPRIQGRVQGMHATVGTCGAAVTALVCPILYERAPELPFVACGAALTILVFLGVAIIRNVERSGTTAAWQTASGGETNPESLGVG
jgi:MFS family permease